MFVFQIKRLSFLPLVWNVGNEVDKDSSFLLQHKFKYSAYYFLVTVVNFSFLKEIACKKN